MKANLTGTCFKPFAPVKSSVNSEASFPMRSAHRRTLARQSLRKIICRKLRYKPQANNNKKIRTKEET